MHSQPKYLTPILPVTKQNQCYTTTFKKNPMISKAIALTMINKLKIPIIKQQLITTTTTTNQVPSIVTTATPVVPFTLITTTSTNPSITTNNIELETRKGLFIQDEEDDDNENDEDKLIGSANEYFDDSPSPNTSFFTFSSNNSSGYSTPTNNNNNNLTPTNTTSSSPQDINYLSNQLISSQITIRAASAAFATLCPTPSSLPLPLPSNNKHSKSELKQQQQQQTTKSKLISYSNFDRNEKREFHILSERRRRYDLKKLFETLRVNIPTLYDKQKASKVIILRTAVEHINETRKYNERLKRTLQTEVTRQNNLKEYLNLILLEKEKDTLNNNNNVNNTSSLS